LLETIHQGAEDLEVRRRAVESIAYSSEPAVAQIIENAYYDENEKMQVSAILLWAAAPTRSGGRRLSPS